MRTQRWNRLKEAFGAALELPPDQREAFVAEACGDDTGMRRELEELLRAAAVDDDFIEQSAADTLGWTAVGDERDWIGRQIGPHRVVELAGRGGLSRVYRAVREHSEYQRQVAIKLLRPGYGGEALLRRFSAERRMLASLSHPNIAHFLDGGATEDGTPYLVMEYVAGRAIDEHCQAQSLALEARVDLFRVLCGAVHYVHQHLMVHGDLKGSNVLVTPEGVVKLLDFGIAKLLTPDATAGDPTRPATVMLLTPDYASPEQLRGESITTASDVYSLGALLYRMLTGLTPYGTDHAPPAVVMERMAAGEPAAPALAAERAGGAHAAFARHLRGDLGTVVLKALKRDPAERYGSAQQLADDLQRWARGFPVEARPDSVGYRLRKWARRHRAAAAFSALAVVALVGGIVATSWQAHLARVERARAERNFKAVRELSSVFLADVYQAIAKIPGSTEARKLLVDNTLKYLQSLERDANDSVELRRDLGIAYERLGDVQGAMLDPSLGEHDAALGSYRRSLAIREQLVRDHPSLESRADLLRGQVTLVEKLLSVSDVAGAQALGAQMVKLADQINADPAAGRMDLRYVGGAYMTQGWMEWSLGHAEPALSTLGRSRDVYRRIAQKYPDDRLARRDLALVLGRLAEAENKGAGDYDASIQLYRETVAALEALVQADPGNGELARMLMYTRANLGEVYTFLRRPEDALRVLEPVLPEFRHLREADPSDQSAPWALAALLNMIGDAQVQLGRFDDARQTFEESATLLDPAVAKTIPDLQLIAGGTQAGFARTYAGLASVAEGAEREAARRRASSAGRQALELLEPLVKAPQLARDAGRLADATRAALDWGG